VKKDDRKDGLRRRMGFEDDGKDGLRRRMG